MRYVTLTRPLATTGRPKQVSTTTVDVNKCVRVYSHVLPTPILGKLQTAFAATSPFWKEHGYLTTTRGGEKKCGYFSYAHDQTRQSTNLMEQVANHVLKLYLKDFPALSECKFVEWWAHCRPHSDGHQMHFDSADEGVGGVRNPIASTVIYLSSSGLGGPTLVTTQRLGDSDVARNGWLVHPVCNAVAMFDGKLLHGVIPGRSVPPASACANNTHDADTHMADTKATGRVSLPMGPRRVTLMIAFWRQLNLRPYRAHAPSAAQALPPTKATECTSWPALLAAMPATAWASVAAPEPIEVQAVGPIWTAVRGHKGEDIPAYADCFQYPRRP